MLQSLKEQPQDKIIRLIQEFRDDPRTQKYDLGVGVYRDRSGTTPIMSAVKRAEMRLWETEKTKAYTGLAGEAEFRDAMTGLTLADSVPSGRLASVHTPGGTGAVRQALELVKLASPSARVWISDPSWPNHLSIADHLGLPTRNYRYFDGHSRAVDFDAMMRDLEEAHAGDVLVLHGCCHNPTGANLDAAAWQAVSDLVLAKGLVPLIDIAYQGFGDGLDEDAAGVRLLASRLPEMLIAASCSKNFGIYRERTGLLLAIAESAAAATRTQATLAHLNRQNFSFPPDHGARLVTMILQDHELRAEWESELREIRERMLRLRQSLAGELRRLSGSDRFGFIAAHRGMFSLLGATGKQVMRMRSDKGIYMVGDSRINVAGLNEESIPVLAGAMLEVGL
ncbi:MAG: aspartate/tyrosine/aromatic aminotransferase [Rhodobacteraceae bacterium]|nr:aspartate/tyrosine/aromatic aminotransferase [Paracoccaceae bacterium]